MSTQALLPFCLMAEWHPTLRRRLALAALLLTSLFVSVAHAGSREQALQIHNRVAGVPPTETILLQMAADIDNGDVAAAVNRAMASETFYSVTLKNMATPWTNREQTVFAPLNDYTATFIGMVRDDEDFRKILSDDVIYVGAPSLNIPAYANNNNNHYEALEAQGFKLGDQSVLVKRVQSAYNGLPSEATSGVLTTRAAAKAFFIDGTNRAMFRFTLMNHFCRDLEQVHDTSLVPDRIRQDVSRSPGGDSRVFLNSCIGCHNGMDPMAQAFAYYDFEHDVDADPEGINGSIHYNGAGVIDPDTGTRVEKKYHINSTTFRYGFVTPDDQWSNYWRQGQNAALGWDTSLPGTGNGAKTMGMELSHSRAFAHCQVEKVFRNVCLRRPADAVDRAKVEEITDSFAGSGYKLKQVFVKTAEYCRGS